VARQHGRDGVEVHVDLAETLIDIGGPGSRARAAAQYHEAHRLFVGLRDRGTLPKSFLPHVDELAGLEARLRPAAP